MNRQVDGQIDGKTGAQTKWTIGQAGSSAYEQIDGQTDRWTGVLTQRAAALKLCAASTQ